MTVIEQIIDIYEAAKKRDRNFNENNYVWLLGCDIVDEIRNHIYIHNTLNCIKIEVDYTHKRKIILAARTYGARSYCGYYNNPGTYEIKNVIFNDPATIVYWADGTKTVVKVQDGERFDVEKGLAMAISKKALGNQGNYYETFKKYCPVEKKPEKPKDVTNRNRCAECLYYSVPVVSSPCHDCYTTQDKVNFVSNKEMSCKTCRHNHVISDKQPCNDCNNFDEFEPIIKKENEGKSNNYTDNGLACVDCIYSSIAFSDKPCIDCLPKGNRDHFVPKNKVSCKNCKYSHVTGNNPPCIDCDDYDKFVPK